MSINFKKLLEWSVKNTKHIFLLDAIGALISSILLGIVMVRFHEVFGIPTSTLYFLAFLPFCFLLYDLFILFWIREGHEIYLRVIVILNVFYCFLSIGLALYHHDKIKNFGIFYIIAEVVVIGFLVKIELTANKLISENNLRKKV